MWSWGNVTVTWGFPLMLVLALWAGAGEVLPLVLAASVCHELGHLTALRLAGVRAASARLSALGAEIRADTRYMPYWRELGCVLAGPGVNLVLALVLARGAGAYTLAGANLLLGVYNLLPVPSLDGGAALRLLVSWGWGPGAADTVCRWVGLLCALALTAAAGTLAAVRHTGGFLLLAALGLIFSQLPLVKRWETG